MTTWSKQFKNTHTSLTIFPSVPINAYTTIAIDAISACPAIVTWIWVTIIDICHLKYKNVKTTPPKRN